MTYCWLDYNKPITEDWMTQRVPGVQEPRLKGYPSQVTRLFHAPKTIREPPKTTTVRVA